ncbi:sarcosine oxidase subunit gamma [Salipiger mangrovisoli]|uniref:Sarcosine oxidase subunit gamma n=1 Tax=Salipiger mangrovisoli TaxID=2865933 RepID=A0ABR9X1E4_9RHOB|nr:sarcosine oxidase subunit gamma [Salipiger mangrovisoli]MBE9637323.1 sarcosine oxidase subunit gamma [Salipiger mangrovisoli]
MTDLIPLTVFGAETPRQTAPGALALAERPDIAIASLALRRGTAGAAPFGLLLPGPGGLAAAQAHLAFWTGAGQWMVLAEGLADTDFAAALRDAAPGCSVTEQTDGWTVVDVTAPEPLIARLLERLVNLPPEALAPGRATRCQMHHLPVHALRLSSSRLRLLAMRSATASLWHALETAGQRLALP